jgi:C1A family cysteine protease
MKRKYGDRILNCFPSQHTEKDWEYDNAVQAKILKESKTAPASVDLRESWWDIGDQEDTGSCVGWASTDALYRWHGVKAKRIAQDDHLSVRFTWMGSKEIDDYRDRPTGFLEQEGTTLKSALDMARKYGIIPDDMLPFKPSTMSKADPDAFYAKAAEFKISSYYSLRKKSSAWPTVVTKWQNWLANGGPILTALGVDDTWDNAESNHGNLDEYHPDTVRGGHAVAIVGYTKDRFIVRNSWGKSWGDKGFGFASHDYARDAFQEAYGISL